MYEDIEAVTDKEVYKEKEELDKALHSPHKGDQLQQLPNTGRYRYDLFLAYSSEDKDKVLPVAKHLQEDYGIKCCLAERDFEVGKYVFINLLKNLEQCRDIAVFVTEKYLQSRWWQPMLTDIEHRCMSETSTRVIPVLLDDFPESRLPSTLKDCCSFKLTADPQSIRTLAYYITGKGPIPSSQGKRKHLSRAAVDSRRSNLVSPWSLVADLGAVFIRSAGAAIGAGMAKMMQITEGLFKRNGPEESKNEGTPSPITSPWLEYTSSISDELYYTQCKVDNRGGCITLPGADVSLYIPPGAVANPEMITLGITRRQQDRLPVTDNQAQVAPVVFCEPHGLKFEKMVFLTISHCIPDIKDKDTFTIRCSETGFDDPCEWKPFTDCGFSMVLHNRCIMGLHHFTKHTISCESKKLEIKIYGKLLDVERPMLYLQVYCIPELPDMVEKVDKYMEKMKYAFLGFGHWALELVDSCEDLCLEIYKFQNSWKLLNGEDQIQRAKYMDLVNDIESCAVFRMRPVQDRCPNTVEFEIKVYRDLSDQEKEQRIICIGSNIKELRSSVSSAVESPNGNSTTSTLRQPSFGRDEDTKRKVLVDSEPNGKGMAGCIDDHQSKQTGGPPSHLSLDQDENTRRKLGYEVNGGNNGEVFTEGPLNNHQGGTSRQMETSQNASMPRYIVEHPPSNVTGIAEGGHLVQLGNPAAVQNCVPFHPNLNEITSDGRFICSQVLEQLRNVFSKENVFKGIMRHAQVDASQPVRNDIQTFEWVFQVYLRSDLKRLFDLCSFLHREALLENGEWLINQVKEACRHMLEHQRIISNYADMSKRMNPSVMTAYLVQAGLIDYHLEDTFTGPSFEANKKLLQVVLNANIDLCPFSKFHQALKEESLGDIAYKLEVNDDCLNKFLYLQAPQLPAFQGPIQENCLQTV